MTEKKPARKKAPAKPKVVKVPLEKITEVRFVNEDGKEFTLVPQRFGKYLLTRFPK